MKILHCEHCSNFFSEPERKVGRPKRFCSKQCERNSWHKREGRIRRKIQLETDPDVRRKKRAYAKEYYHRANQNEPRKKIYHQKCTPLATAICEEFERSDLEGRIQLADALLNFPPEFQGYAHVRTACGFTNVDYWLADYNSMEANYVV